MSTVSTPPTPFADRESLEAELLAIEREIGTIKLAKQMQQSQEPDQTSLTSLTMPDLVETEESRPSLAALRHLKADDIDSFIANMAVPPPPTKQTVFKQHSPVVELTTEDISAFIIPPPPGEAGFREIQELRVSQEVVEVSRGSRDTTPKMVSVKERINLLKGQEGKINFARSPEGDLKGKELGLNLTKDKYGYPLQGGQMKSPRKDAMDVPNSNIAKGGVQNKREIFMRQLGSPDTYKPFVKVTESMEAPPPPPPPIHN